MGGATSIGGATANGGTAAGGRSGGGKSEACTATVNSTPPANAPVLEPGVWKNITPPGLPLGDPVSMIAQGIAIDPVAVFIARAEACALLYAAGEFDLHTAVDVLQADAERAGLVASIGQDEVQRIIAEAFAAVGDWP